MALALSAPPRCRRVKGLVQLTPHPRKLGAEGELRAARWLLDRGWTIVKRNFKGRRGEIDILAVQDNWLVAFEVKLRTTGFPPEESVTPKKQGHMKAAIQEYLHQTQEPAFKVRFDILAIHGDEVRHIEDAFR